jgi:hypothetical protein
MKRIGIIVLAVMVGNAVSASSGEADPPTRTTYSFTYGATPPKTIASHCSKSGDVCYGAVDRDGLVRLEITTAAKYFGRYTLCVRPGTQGAERFWRCGSFPVFRHGSTWSSSVRIDHFPVVGPAVCRVAWKLRKGHPLGPSLLVRVPKA